MEKVTYIVTWRTKNSHLLNKPRKVNTPLRKPVYFSFQHRCEIFNYLAQIIQEFKMKSLALNVLDNHVHLVIESDEMDISNQIRKLKSKSTYLFKIAHKYPKERRLNLWAVRFNKSPILTKIKLHNSIKYVETNHIKHNLVDCREKQMLASEL
jgi:REP element-mobilizing transposase RayT